MSETEYEAALSDFLRSKRVTRCPTACVSPTYGTVAETDRNALRSTAMHWKLRASKNFRTCGAGGIPHPLTTRADA